MKTKIAALMIALMTVCATYAQYYSGKVGETISLPNPSTPAGYNGILESTYSSDSKYLSVYPGTSSVKILSYFSGTETVRCDFTCYREVYSAGRLYYYYGTSSAYYYIKCSSSAPALQLSASPDGGQIGIGQTIKLSVTYNGSDISGCDIYYTLNGSTPSKSSTRYNSGITIDGDCTLKAIAYKDGYKTSDVLTVKYTVVDITLTADPAGGYVTKGTVVHLYSNKSNASIRYTLNGSTPTLGDPIYKPTEGIVINQSCTLKATAKINGKNNSIISTPVMEWKYTISSGKLVLTATPSGGQVSKGSVVKLATKAEGTTVSADIYYTLNGTTPSKSSTKYSSSGISINSDCTLKAIAYKSGYETSNILTSNYTIKDDVTLTANSYTRVYGDDNPTFEFIVSGGTITSGNPTITCSATKESPVGTYDIMISKGTVSNSNVKLVKGTLTISPAPLNVIAGNYTRLEGEKNPTFTLTYNGFKNDESEDELTEKPTVTTTATEDSTPGDYPVTVSGGSAKNYALTYENGTLTVIKKSDVTLTANSYTRVYGDDNPAFEYTVSGGTITSGEPTITCSATKESPVGTYDIVINKGSVSNDNVKLEKGTLTITMAPLTIKADDKQVKQGETLPEFTATYSGFKNNETESVLVRKPVFTCTATESSAPGNYEIVVSNADAENYSISYEKGTLTITDADLITVTAKSYTRSYGDMNPEFDYTVNGGTLQGTPNITCAVTKTSDVGTYDIIISQGSISNPNVQYVNGKITITAAPLTISVGSYTMRQGDPMPQFAATYSGFRNNEGEEVLSVKPQFACEANENSAPGTYKVGASCAEAKNYAIEYVSGTLTILSAVTSDEMAVSTTTAGSLSTEIGNSIWKTIRSLTISGQVNGTDIRLIRKMLKEGKLEELNLRDAKIVSGGDSYDIYGLSKTSENAIGESMFYDCRNLKKIILPSSTQRIESYAFFGCSGLKQIELPATCVTVGDYAIAFCDSLTSVTIPAGIMRIGESAFTYCTSLSTIYSEIDNMNDIVSSDYYFSPFDGIADDCLWHVPAGTKNAYTSLSWWDRSWGIIDDLNSSASAIEKVTANRSEKDAWYTLRGMKINGVPTIPGIYIHNGKKVVIRK